MQDALADYLKETPTALGWKRIVELQDSYNRDVAAAVDWIKKQPFVDADRIVITGCSYGGIQTLLAAEKGLGAKAFVPFAPAAMSWANTELRKRMTECARNAESAGVSDSGEERLQHWAERDVGAGAEGERWTEPLKGVPGVRHDAARGSRRFRVLGAGHRGVGPGRPGVS